MRIIVVSIFFWSVVSVTAQSVEQFTAPHKDSLFVAKEKDTLHSPKKAALLSLIPGGGQIYNHLAMPKGKKKAFWKVPLIYAGLGVTGYYGIQKNQLQKNLKNEYIFRAKTGYADLEEFANYDDQGVLTLFEKSRTSRDVMIFAFLIVYGINILDAYVEAHFVHFDVSKNLSLQLNPTISDWNTPMLSFTFSFK